MEAQVSLCNSSVFRCTHSSPLLPPFTLRKGKRMSITAASRVFRGCGALLASAKSSATGTASKSSTITTPKPKATAKPISKPREKSAKPAGILKPLPVSPALSNFLSASEASRTEAVKTIWAYIKLHNLQNPTKKKEIICDEKLKTIFNGKDKVGILEIGKLLSPHFPKASS